jgi:ATP-binding protein involved in chromosome partitioning
VKDLIQIGVKAKPDLRFGTSQAPNDRAGFARAVVAVTSGKGGVGKSTVAVNLAVGCAQRGLRVGLLDADVYGPSVPRMLSLHGERLEWSDDDKMIPAENFGVRVVSTALTTPELDTPLAWRSSVATSALIQLIDDVAWGGLDLLFVDMPPGTGDVQITVVQEVRVTYAVVVTTPQTVATDDVARAIRMLADVGVPAGVVENMSFFRAPDTGAIYHPFGEGGGRALAERYQLPLLGALALDPAVMSRSDEGQPVVAGGDPEDQAPWQALVSTLLAQPSLRARLEPSTLPHNQENL